MLYEKYDKIVGKIQKVIKYIDTNYGAYIGYTLVAIYIIAVLAGYGDFQDCPSSEVISC